MAEVLLINEKGFHVGCVNQNHKYTLNTMISSCVAINSTLQELRNELSEKGHALQVLLECKHPNAVAALVAVEDIKSLLQDQPVDISDQWVTARARDVDGKKKFISDHKVRKVSILSLFSHLLCFIFVACLNLLFCLGDVTGPPQLCRRFIPPLRQESRGVDEC